MDTSLELAVISSYRDFGQPADQILIEDDPLEGFIKKLPQEHQTVEKPKLGRLILNLRKRGKLPRTQRF